MKVAFDTSPLTNSHKGRGVGTYTHNLMNALKRSKTDLTFIFTNHPQTSEADLIHYPYFDLFSHSLPLKHSAKVIATIHDVIPLVFPHHFPRGPKGSINLFFQKRALSNTNHIITDSKHSKIDIQSHLNQPSTKITPIKLAASNNFKPQTSKLTSAFKKKYHLDKPFVTYVGDINYNKNLPKLLHAFSQITGAYLVIVTRASLEQDIPEATIINNTVKQLKLKESVKFLDLPTPADLAVLYSASDWYIQPSLYEGFGLPVLEAFMCHTPVLCSNASSLPEVAGEAALYFDPSNKHDITKTINKALSMKPIDRQKLINQGKRQVKKFSWDKTAKETISLYQTVIHTK